MILDGTPLPPPTGPLLGEGNVAEVFGHGEGVLKLYRAPDDPTPVFIEAANLAIVAARGLPVPAVFQVGRYGERWGLVMGRAAGTPLAAQALADAQRVGEVLGEMVQLQCLLHCIAEPRLVALKPRLRRRIETVALPAPLRQKLLDQLDAMPDGNTICHGDFHPFNLIGGRGERTTIIDWLDATSGPPAADACRSFLLLRQGVPGLAQEFLALYLARSGLSEGDVLSWLPILAAARLAEGIAAENDELMRLAAGGPP